MSLDTHDRTCRRLAKECDVDVLAVDYRLAPEHPYPAAIDDAVEVLRDEGEAYARRLAESGVLVTYRREPGLPHGFIQGMDLTSPGAAAAQQRIFADIRRLIAPGAPDEGPAAAL